MTFTVTIVPAELRLDVARDEPILAAAIRAGISLPYGCKDGACGSCKSRLMEGRVIHGAHQLKALTPDEEAAGYILTCCATPQTDCVVQSRSASASTEFPVMKLPARVMSLARPAADVTLMRLQLPANQSFRWRAGQYVDVLLRDGARRSYSMANAPENLGDPPSIELHLRHLPGGKFTDHVFGAMKEKEILRLEGPFGSFYLREESAKPMILLASGTGFAPVKALIEHLRAKGITDRPATLYWGCRSRADLYLHDWAEAAAAELPWLRYVPVLSEPRADDAWRGRIGLVHEAVMADWPDLSGHQVYVCGAPVMVAAAQRDLTARCHLPDDEFFADAFTSEADKATA